MKNMQHIISIYEKLLVKLKKIEISTKATTGLRRSLMGSQLASAAKGLIGQKEQYIRTLRLVAIEL